MLDFKEYTNGTRTIKATVKMYEMLYRNFGYKPVGKNIDEGKSNRSNKAKNSADSSGETTDERYLAVLG